MLTIGAAIVFAAATISTQMQIQSFSQTRRDGFKLFLFWQLCSCGFITLRILAKNGVFSSYMVEICGSFQE